MNKSRLHPRGEAFAFVHIAQSERRSCAASGPAGAALGVQVAQLVKFAPGEFIPVKFVPGEAGARRCTLTD